MREVEQRGANNATAYGKESGGIVGISDTERGPSAAFRRRAEQDDDEEEEDANRSDSDSTVMMSGNSPFVSKSARYNFLQRSGNEKG